MELNNAQEIISRHEPVWLLSGHFGCAANGCFFKSSAGEDAWDEYAYHLAEALENE